MTWRVLRVVFLGAGDEFIQRACPKRVSKYKSAAAVTALLVLS